MSIIVYGTYCNPTPQFGLSFYCQGSTSACNIFRNFTSVSCLSQPSQLYCTNQQACGGANITNDIYIEFSSAGAYTATDYDTVTRANYQFNRSFPIAAYTTSNTARRDPPAPDQLVERTALVQSLSQNVLTTFQNIYNGNSANPTKLLVNSLASTLFGLNATGGTTTSVVLQNEIRDALFAALASSTNQTVAEVQQCKELNATADGMSSVNKQFITNITREVPPNSLAIWLLTNFVGHIIANSAVAEEVDIIKSVVTLSSSGTACVPSVSATSVTSSTPTQKSTTSSKSLTSLSKSSNSPQSSISSKSSILSSKSSSSSQSSISSKSLTTYSMSTSASLSSTSSKGSTASSLSHTPLPTANCSNIFVLSGADERKFNPQGASVTLKPGCGLLNVSTITAWINSKNTTDYKATAAGVTLHNLTDETVHLAIAAFTTTGAPALGSFYLLFGRTNMSAYVFDSNGKPAPNVPVQANATIYTGISQAAVTDVNGKASFVNLPSTTVALFARGLDGSLAVNGVASTQSNVTLHLIAYGQPSNITNWDFSDGLVGWSNGTLIKHVENNTFPSPTNKRQDAKDMDLLVSTNGQETLQSASGSFKLYTFSKSFYVRYRFQTNEIPGGFFGSQFNDYYSVSLRTDTGAFTTTTNSMNALGYGAFDEDGYTDWYVLTLPAPPKSTSGRVDIGVANVADARFDSSVIVDKAGDPICDDCQDCSSCPSNPMCQNACSNPPQQSCAFYSNCMEATVPCLGDAYSYAIDYGQYYCNRYLSNIDNFSPAGQQFVFGTGQCLQKALVTSLSSCEATCSSLRSTAFNSHPRCYADNGFCELSCKDLWRVVTTVWNSFGHVAAYSQAFSETGICAGKVPSDWGQLGCPQDIEIGSVAAAVLAAVLGLKVIIGF